jgi:hypothetical protein
MITNQITSLNYFDKNIYGNQCIRYSFINGKIYRLLQRKYLGFNLRNHFSKMKWDGLENGHIQYLLRIDDFPRWDLSLDNYMLFDNILKKHKVSSILGVTPFLNYYLTKREYTLSRNEILYLKSYIERGGTIALHGFTHGLKKNKKIIGTLNLYTEKELIETIHKTNDYFNKIGLSMPKIFIPPFNAVEPFVANILQKYFKILMGGPLTIDTLGPFGVGENVGEMLYLPSYFPFYGHCVELEKNIFKIKNERKVIMPITIHWAWEVGDNFNSLDRLLLKIKNKIVSIDEILDRWDI